MDLASPEEIRQVGLAAGWGSAALAYLADDPDRSIDFELWLTTYIGMVPDYQPGTTLESSLKAGRHMLAHLARMLGLAE